jgi:hypothetical protein
MAGVLDNSLPRNVQSCRLSLGFFLFSLFVAGVMGIFFTPEAAKAATFYCDPVDGNTVTGDGSSENP